MKVTDALFAGMCLGLLFRGLAEFVPISSFFVTAQTLNTKRVGPIVRRKAPALGWMSWERFRDHTNCTARNPEQAKRGETGRHRRKRRKTFEEE